MPVRETARTTTSAPENVAGDPSQYGKRTAEAAAPGLRAAEKVAEKTAEASQESEFLRTQMETTQDAMRAGMEAGVRSFEGLTATVSRAFGMATPNGELAEQSERNVQSVSQASTALAHGAQEASRVWLALAQQGMRTNLEALSQLARCRTIQDVVAVQSNLARDNLQRVIDGGQAIARCTVQALDEANRVMQSDRRKAGSTA